MHSLMGSIWQFLQGSLVGKSLLWLKLGCLRESLQPEPVVQPASRGSGVEHHESSTDGGGGEIRREYVSTSVACVTALLALGRAAGVSAEGEEGRSLQLDMAYIAGSLGFQDTHSVTHNGLTLATRIKAVDCGLSVDNNGLASNLSSQLACHPTYLKIDLVASKLLYCVFEASTDVAQVIFLFERAYEGFVCHGVYFIYCTGYSVRLLFGVSLTRFLTRFLTFLTLCSALLCSALLCSALMSPLYL